MKKNLLFLCLTLLVFTGQLFSQVTYPCGVYFLSLNGTTDHGVWNNVYVTNNYTLAAWIQIRDSVWQGNEMDIFQRKVLSTSPSDYDDGLDLYLATDGQLKYRAYIFKNGAAVLDSVSSGIKPDPFKWYHVAVTFKSTGDCNIYINGNLAASKSFGGPMSVNYPYLNYLTIGGKISYIGINNPTFSTFKGYMDEVAVAETAFTQTQVDSLANGISPGSPFIKNNAIDSYDKEDTYPGRSNSGIGGGSVAISGQLHYCSYNLPIANAGPDQTITLPDNSVTLSGSVTLGTGTITSGVWTKESGPAGGDISDPNSQTPLITNLQEGTYVFKLTLTDNNGYVGTDEVTITVESGTEDTTFYKCPGAYVDISGIVDPLDYLNVSWQTADGTQTIDPTKVDTGEYKLLTTKDNSTFETTHITVVNYSKPDLGPDTTQVFCPATYANESLLYETSGYTSVGWFTVSGFPVDSTLVPFEEVHLIVQNEFGCFDTASVFPVAFPVHDILPAQPQTRIANREQPDGFDPSWTNYYYDYKDSVGNSQFYLLLSIQKRNQDIGTIGDGTFQVKVVATSQAGSGTAIRLTNPNITNPEPFAMNRYWSVTATKEPQKQKPVGVRYYYNNSDFDDLKSSVPRLTDANSNEQNESLYFYVVHGGNNPDPNSNFDGVTPDELMNGAEAGLDTYVYNNLECGEHQVEFLVDEFSGGGGGATVNGLALPITLQNFNGSLQNKNTVLNWQTTQETNATYFIIERSTTGNNFSSIGKVYAAGSSLYVENYSYTDKQPAAGTNYYRLQLVDANGKFTYSKTIMVNNNGGSSLVRIFPNPATDVLQIKTEGDNEFATLQVFDASGRKLIEQNVMLNSSSYSLEVRGLSKGVYELVIKSRAINSHQKFVKQ